jgi:carboxypeptidase Q
LNKLNLFIIACALFANMIFPQVLNQEKEKHYRETALKITREALTENVGYELLRELCEIGPRLSGSENSLKAIYWAEQKMKDMGFDSVWLQPVMVPHWDRGNIESAVIAGTGKELNISALGGSVPTPDEGITAEVLEVKNFEQLDSLKEKAKGKIIFFSRELDHGLVNTFAGYGGAVDQRSRGPIKAAAAGAVGVIIRSVTTLHDNVPHTGMTSYVDTLPKIPAAAVGNIDADFLSDALKKDPSLKVTLKLNCRTLPDALSYNVIGDIRGYEKPEEIILTGGHFDSWDAGCGAHDDGGGCIQALESIELFKRLNIKNKRTLRCVFFINEENGIKGAIEYARFSDSTKQNHYAAIESDRGVFTPKGFSFDADSALIQNVQKWLPVLRTAGIEYIRKGGSGVDISRIKNAKALIGYVPDDQRYMDVHHSANDTFESVHPREMQLGTAAIAILVYLIDLEGF